MLAASVACTQSANELAKFGQTVNDCIAGSIPALGCGNVLARLNALDKARSSALFTLCLAERNRLLDIAGHILVNWRRLGASQPVLQHEITRLAAVKLIRRMADAERSQAMRDRAAAVLVRAAQVEDSKVVLPEVILGLHDNISQKSPVNYRNDAILALEKLRERGPSFAVMQLAGTVFERLKPLIGKPTLIEEVLEPLPEGPPGDVKDEGKDKGKDKGKEKSRLLPIALAASATAAFGLVLWLALRSRPQRASAVSPLQDNYWRRRQRRTRLNRSHTRSGSW